MMKILAGAEQSHLRTNRKQMGLGAEAQIILMDNLIVKKRIAKGYRLPVLDEKLRKLRTRSEAKIMEKLSNIINVPKIIKVDDKTKEIIMEFIPGLKLSDNLDSFTLQNQEDICKQIGQEVAKIHDLDLIHGDLTTSNMILVNNNTKNEKKCCHDVQNSLVFNKNSIGVSEQGSIKIYFIDFGLGFHSSKIEDKAVDIHLFKQALESRHFKHWQKLFQGFLSGYITKDKTRIIAQLDKVELRGRYKH